MKKIKCLLFGVYADRIDTGSKITSPEGLRRTGKKKFENGATAVKVYCPGVERYLEYGSFDYFDATSVLKEIARRGNFLWYD